ncbi:MAG: hypothetical protein H0T45_18210 [Pyrinomonadaceae bacterium]|nr:hypothetical protein [Pyrinomonadaceae bacterium]
MAGIVLSLAFKVESPKFRAFSFVRSVDRIHTSGGQLASSFFLLILFILSIYSVVGEGSNPATVRLVLRRAESNVIFVMFQIEWRLAGAALPAPGLRQRILDSAFEGATIAWLALSKQERLSGRASGLLWSRLCLNRLKDE